jgi:ACS family tartrate transporter-like MFS transporter
MNRALVEAFGMDSTLQESTMLRVAWRLLPLLFVLMIVNYLDRVNVGFAALRMNKDLGFSATVYGFGAGVFFIGYALVEIPSNLLLHRMGARVWICRIMVTWGLIATAMALVRSANSFYILRFVLGIAEAGFLPGIVYYISNWFPAGYRARANAAVFCATVLSPVIGAPLSTAILTWMDGIGTVPGWQWMFVLEGVPAVALGFVVLFYLTNKPEQAGWLQPAQREWLTATLLRENNALERGTTYTLRTIWTDKRVWQLGVLFSCLNAGGYGLLLWMPQIIKGLGQLSDITVGLLTMAPFALGFVGQMVVSRHSDRTGERRLHLAGCYLAACLFLLASAFIPGAVARYISLCLVGATLYAGTPIFWTLAGTFMTGAAAAAGIAFINTLAQIGGFFGPYLIGVIKDSTESFTLALCMLSAFLLTAGLIAITLRKETEGGETNLAFPLQRRRADR